MKGSVYPYCSCRDSSGEKYAAGKCLNWNARGHKKWAFIVDIGKVDGKRQQLRRHGFTTRTAAEKELADEIGAVNAGSARSLSDRKITVSQWTENWLQSRVNLRPSTQRSYEALIRNYIDPGLGSVLLTELRPEHVDHWLARVRSGRLAPKVRRRREGAPPSVRTVNGALTLLSTIIETAIKRRKITWNPCTAVEQQTAPQYEATVWSPAEAVAFIEFAETECQRWAIGYRLALTLGLRRGEIIGLRWQDVDLNGGTLRVRHNAVEVGNRVVVGSPKTRKGARLLALDRDDVTALAAHRKTQLRQRMSAESWTGDGDLVVTDEHGEMVAPHRFGQRFDSLVRRAHLPVIRLHDARHSSATWALEAGLPTRVVSERLGHSTTSVTSDIYQHVRPALDGAAAEKMGDLLRAASTDSM